MWTEPVLLKLTQGDIRMDLKLRRLDVALEQKHSKPSASSGAGVKFVDVKEVGANHPLLYKQSLDVYGHTVHTGMMKGIRCA